MILPGDQSDAIASERRRIEAEYRRRAAEIRPDLYAPWQPWNRLEIEQRVALADSMLRRAAILPATDGDCLEVGCGTGGWLNVLAHWGFPASSLHGIDLNPERVDQARAKFPAADLRVGDACSLPWPSASFRLVVISVVVTSILDPVVRRRLAEEIERVLAPGGALLWYDFAFNNPRNRNVRKVTAAELRELFPHLSGRIARVTLAPPLARAVAGRSWRLAKILSGIPCLQTHLLAVLLKPGASK